LAARSSAAGGRSGGELGRSDMASLDVRPAEELWSGSRVEGCYSWVARWFAGSTGIGIA